MIGLNVASTVEIEGKRYGLRVAITDRLRERSQQELDSLPYVELSLKEIRLVAAMLIDLAIAHEAAAEFGLVECADDPKFQEFCKRRKREIANGQA